MKKQLRLLTVLLFALFGGVNVWAVTYTWTTAKDQLSATTTSVTVDDVTWQFSPTWQDDTKTYVSWSGGSTNCYQIGSSNNPLSVVGIKLSVCCERME